MPFRSILSALLLFLLAHPDSAFADVKAEAEAQTVSQEEARASAAQDAFEREFEFDPAFEEDSGKEPDFSAIFRRGVKRRVGSGTRRRTVIVVPQVAYGIRFTGPSTYHEGEDAPLPPASTSKVFTAAWVLKELGGDYRYETRLNWVKAPGATEAAYLTLVAAGDPSLATSELPKLTDAFVAGLVAAGVKKIYGPLRFSATDSRWSIRTVPEGWEPGDLHTATGFIQDSLGTMTEARMKTALAAKLAKKKIQWISARAAPFAESAGALESASYFSEPMRELIQPFLLHSINYKGEAFLRKIGELRGSRAAPNLHDAGLPLLREFASETLARGGTPTVHGTPGFLLNDGSGLSRTSRVTARLMVDFLDAVKHEPFFEDLLAALPIAGRTGTLGRRMSGSSAAGRVHAKTGTLDRNYQLAGYLKEATKEGFLYHSFAILTETDSANAGYCRSVEDAALANLAWWMLLKK